MFRYAIVRKPSKNFAEGITISNLGKPDYDVALKQHEEYVRTLEKCGLHVVTLESDERFPDSTFVEDPAIVTDKCAIITNLGAQSRKGEEIEIRKVLEKYYENIEVIQDPGTVEGGDIMRVEDHFYIGLSKRTNEEGAKQLKEVLEKYGYTASTIAQNDFLHLKTGVVYIGDDNIVAAGEFKYKEDFKNHNIINVEDDECYAANCIRINDYIIMPKGFTKTKSAIEKANYQVIEVDMSEFEKMDGGLTCLSLRF